MKARKKMRLPEERTSVSVEQLQAARSEKLIQLLNLRSQTMSRKLVQTEKPNECGCDNTLRDALTKASLHRKVRK